MSLNCENTVSCMQYILRVEDVPILSITIEVGLNPITTYSHAKTLGLIFPLSFLGPFLFQSELEIV